MGTKKLSLALIMESPEVISISSGEIPVISVNDRLDAAAMSVNFLRSGCSMVQLISLRDDNLSEVKEMIEALREEESFAFHMVANGNNEEFPDFFILKVIRESRRKK